MTIRMDAIKISPPAPTTNSRAIVGPTSAMLDCEKSTLNLAARSLRIAVSSFSDRGLVVISTRLEPACWTVASTLNVSISFCTAVACTGCLKVRLYWSPPAKSIPRRKPRNAIEMIPGRMMARESKKYRLRRPTIFMASSGRLGRGRLHAVEGEPTGRPQSSQDLQELLRGDDGGEHADADADRQGNRKTLDQRGAEEIEHEAGNQGRDVRVPDCRPRPMHACFHCGAEGPTSAQFLLEALEDQHVGVDRHSDREDEPRQARQRQGDAEELEDRQRDRSVDEQGDTGDQAGEPVVEEHEEDDDGKPERTGQQAQLDGRRAESRADLSRGGDRDGAR